MKIVTDLALDNIKYQKEEHHDTIYCNEAQESELKDRVTTLTLHSSNIDNICVMGLNVQVLPIDRPIVCRKGEVFDLAKDYKNDTVYDDS